MCRAGQGRSRLLSTDACVCFVWASALSIPAGHAQARLGHAQTCAPLPQSHSHLQELTRTRQAGSSLALMGRDAIDQGITQVFVRMHWFVCEGEEGGEGGG